MDGSEKPLSNPRGISDVIYPLPVHTNTGYLSKRGPFPTKSHSTLNVAFALSQFETARFFNSSSPDEVRRLPGDPKGFRIYINDGIRKGRVGATEFHRVREEIVYCLLGEVFFTVEDVWGEKVSYVLSKGDGIWMPPFIYHRYEGVAEESWLMAVACTLFDPEDPATKDSYSFKKFKKLQGYYR